MGALIIWKKGVCIVIYLSIFITVQTIQLHNIINII